MACSCISEVNARLAERNTRITIPIMLGEDQTVRPMIVTEQIKAGRGKRKTVGLFASHCPFCGIVIAVQRAEKVRELTAAIAKVRCGDCDKWMKSRQCPREHNVRGQSRGPSCEGMPCGQFVETVTARDRRQANRDKLAALHVEFQP